MPTSRSCIKCTSSVSEREQILKNRLNTSLEKHLWNGFLLYLVVEISSYPEVLYERSVLKNFLKFTDKHKKPSFGGVLSKEKMFLKILRNSQKNIFAGVSFLIKLQAGNLKLSEAATGDVLLNNVFLKILQTYKVAILGACNFIKKDSDADDFL